MTLEEEWAHWRRQLARCCGPIIFKYEPGVTYCLCAECKRKVAKPDWDPQGVVEEWNAGAHELLV